MTNSSSSTASTTLITRVLPAVVAVLQTSVIIVAVIKGNALTAAIFAFALGVHLCVWTFPASRHTEP